jgi:hypothetical protein
MKENEQSLTAKEGTVGSTVNATTIHTERLDNEDRGVLNGDDDDGLTRTVSQLFIILYIIQTSNRNTNTILSQRHN